MYGNAKEGERCGEVRLDKKIVAATTNEWCSPSGTGIVFESFREVRRPTVTWV